jgi:MFS transporter, putative metabolite:H+ symporter
MSNIANRLERLPFGRFHYRLLLMGGLGYMFEAVDAAIIAFLLPVLRSQWQLTSVETGLLASSTYFGFLVGALVAGGIGDRYGRRTVMMSALVLFSLAALASAFVNDWHTFFLLRVIGGVGMGAEAAIIAPFLSEFVSADRRGSFTASLAGFFSFGTAGNERTYQEAEIGAAGEKSGFDAGQLPLRRQFAASRPVP